MKRRSALIICIVLILGGCVGGSILDSKNHLLTGDKPPEATIKIGNETYETTLGTYCWSGKRESKCVDKAGPIELLEGKEPIRVNSNETVSFIMNYDPLPNEVHVLQINNDKETDVKVENNQFLAPKKPGTYYYYYGVWWMDEKKENVSHGDAFYAFALEVK